MDSSAGTANQHKASYKVVLENVTQEKKKLNTTVSYSDQAPPGYTFVPVGVPELSEYCKELSRREGLQVIIVSDEPTSKAALNAEKISHHVHRIGTHFANHIVEKACAWYAHRQKRRSQKQKKGKKSMSSSNIAKRLKSHEKRLGLPEKGGDAKQRTEQVAQTIRELFPKIPEKDLKAIVKRAFEEGSDRIGNAADLPLARRVQLAVVAHIRHVHTHYDQLLKVTSWANARANVEQMCLDQVVKWRGEEDDQDGAVELEEIFREVIVIDDEAEDDAGSGDDDNSSERSSSVEFVSSRPLADPVRQDQAQAELRNHPELQALVQRYAAAPPPPLVTPKPQRHFATRRILESDEIGRRYEESRARMGFKTGHQRQPSNLSLPGPQPMPQQYNYDPERKPVQAGFPSSSGHPKDPLLWPTQVPAPIPTRDRHREQRPLQNNAHGHPQSSQLGPSSRDRPLQQDPTSLLSAFVQGSTAYQPPQPAAVGNGTQKPSAFQYPPPPPLPPGYIPPPPPPPPPGYFRNLQLPGMPNGPPAPLRQEPVYQSIESPRHPGFASTQNNALKRKSLPDVTAGNAPEYNLARPQPSSTAPTRKKAKHATTGRQGSQWPYPDTRTRHQQPAAAPQPQNSAPAPAPVRYIDLTNTSPQKLMPSQPQYLQPQSPRSYAERTYGLRPTDSQGAPAWQDHSQYTQQTYGLRSLDNMTGRY